MGEEVFWPSIPSGQRSGCTLHVNIRCCTSRQHWEEHIWEFVRMGREGKERRKGKGVRPSTYTALPPSAPLKLFGRFCILLPLQLSSPSFLPASASAPPPSLSLSPSTLFAYICVRASGGGGSECRIMSV